MSPLPAPPAAPLHILQQSNLLGLAALAAGLLVVLLLFLLDRYLKKQSRQTPPPPVPTSAPPAGRPAAGIATRIRALEEAILASKAFRDGCHRLAMLIKSHIGRETNLEAEWMTSREIQGQLEPGKADARLGGFLTQLSHQRYGREEPRRRDFVAACEEARVLLAIGKGNR